jgi:PEP-CTERM motif
MGKPRHRSYVTAYCEKADIRQLKREGDNMSHKQFQPKVFSAIFCLTSFLALAGAANATLFTAQASFDAANPGLSILTFEGIAAPATGKDISGVFPGVTLSDSTGFPLAALSATFTNPVFPGASSDFVTINHYEDTLKMVFDTAQQAAGFTVAVGYTGGLVATGPLTFTVLNGVTVLETDTLTINGLQSFNSFVGYSGLAKGITEIDIAPAVGSFEFASIDNLKFTAVPEPSGLFLLASGLALLGGVAWLQRRCG